MSQSENIELLASALVKAQGEFPTIKKTKNAKIPTKNGGSYEYDYADLGDIREAVVPVLTQYGLAVTQAPTINGDNPTLTTTLLHESGQWKESEMLLHIEKTDAQGQGSAITYARRYAMSAILGIVTESDDDGVGATRKRNETKEGSVKTADGSYDTGNDDLNLILKAADIEPSNEFMVSLANQIRSKGTLSPKQIGSGVPQALKIVSANEPKDVNPATNDTLNRIEEGLKMLGPVEEAAYKLWWMGEKIPPLSKPDKISETEAQKALSHLIGVLNTEVQESP